MMKAKRFLSGLLACLLAIPGFSAGTKAAAAGTWKFDLGGGGAASGFTGVSAADGYNAGAGYGFSNTSGVKNVASSGSGANSDAVQFTSASATFNVDLPKGLYQVTVTTGDTSRTSIKAEGMLQLINLTGNNAYETFQLPVTDGQLNIQAVAGRENTPFSISAIEIVQLNSTGTTNPTIWLCGDSTVANYYNTPDTAQHGWGQYLADNLSGTPASGYQVRNMAASGQFAKGFVDGGQFDAIEAYGTTGDYYVIAIGINDTNYSNKEEYTQVVTDMVRRARKKGMEVILVKQQGRRGDLTRSPLLGGRWFGGELDAVGAAESVKVVDLFTPWQDFGLSLGYDAMGAYYAANDDLHQSKKGSQKLAELMAGLLFENAEAGTPLQDVPEIFMLRNGSSGQYLSLEGAPEDGTNVVQLAAPGIDSGYAVWKAVADGNGYYHICNLADETKLLDVYQNKAANGTNIGVWSDTGSDAQLYQFIKQENGSYIITTKPSSGKSAVEVINASNDSGANVQEWERNGHACQTWFLDNVVMSVQDVIAGDINGDGVVDVFDAVLLKREILGGEMTHTRRKASDLNGDAAVSVADAVVMQKFLHGTGSITCTAEGKNVYYAIDQAYSKGYFENTNAGFTSDGYVNLDNNNMSFIEFTVNVPVDGNFLCTFNIANGSASNRQCRIEVNDNAEYWMQDFLSTGAWTDWTERALVLPLKKGANLVRVTSATADGAPNIDYMRTEWTDEPIAETYVPNETPDPGTITGSTTIYIAGDSTVQSYRASYAPQQGWGYYLGNYFTEKVTVSNHAIAGRSSKSFYDNGRLQTILDSIQKGDYLLVQFAINDSASGNAERYAPTCGNVDNPAAGSYEWYMTQYIKGALDKGATPVLVTTVIGLKAYSGGKFVNSYTNYCDACKKLAKKYSIPCIDLNTLMVNHYNSIGYDAAYKYHLAGAVAGSTDMTHFTETGANAVAGLVANDIKGLGLPVSSEVK